MLSGFPVAFVNTVRPASESSQATATTHRLPHESKLRKVLHELKIGSLSDTAPHKQQLLSLVAKYLDIFDQCYLDVGTTNLTFHEIDTGDVRPLRQPVRRLPNGEIRAAVESEIDKLVSADIARVDISVGISSRDGLKVRRRLANVRGLSKSKFRDEIRLVSADTP